MTTVAIDFGTSNTVVSVLDRNKAPISLRFPQMSRIFRQQKSSGEIVEMPVIPQYLSQKKGVKREG
jgi:molecular chaperone DnaK (HSP70)